MKRVVRQEWENVCFGQVEKVDMVAEVEVKVEARGG